MAKHTGYFSLDACLLELDISSKREFRCDFGRRETSLEFGGVEELPAAVALVPPGVLVAAERARPEHVAVRQEPQHQPLLPAPPLHLSPDCRTSETLQLLFAE